jgi:hypothetical protein
MTGPDNWQDARRDALALVECCEKARAGLVTPAEAISDARILMGTCSAAHLERVLLQMAGIAASLASYSDGPGYIRRHCEMEEAGWQE